MAQSNEELKELLRVAEGKLEQLGRENEGLIKSFEDMMQAQALEAEQMVELTEKMWELEKNLKDANFDVECARMLLDVMKGHISSIRERMEETLAAAKEGASQLEMAARVYEISETSHTKELDRLIEEYNASLNPKKRK